MKLYRGIDPEILAPNLNGFLKNIVEVDKTITGEIGEFRKQQIYDAIWSKREHMLDFSSIPDQKEFVRHYKFDENMYM